MSDHCSHMNFRLNEHIFDDFGSVNKTEKSELLKNKTVEKLLAPLAPTHRNGKP